MSELIRFKNWLLDREQIESAFIESEDKKDHNDYEKINHTLIVRMKSGKQFILICSDRYDAKKELNYLTANLSPQHTHNNFEHYLVRQVYICRSTIAELDDTIKKLINSYKKAKNKEKKGTK